MCGMKIFALFALIALSSCATPKVDTPSMAVNDQQNEKLVHREATVMIMTEKVFNFAPNSAELDVGDKKELQKVIRAVLKNKDRYRRIEIVGHSDQTGTEDLNLDISKERAISVLDAMKQAGIDRKKIRTSWMAGTEPVEEGAIDSSINRRVEIRLFETKTK